jgi:deoxyribodipyrimidine photo-lyase
MVAAPFTRKLGKKLADLGAPLMLLSGDPATSDPGLVEKTGASAVYWNRRYDPAFLSKDASLKDALQSRDIVVESFRRPVAARTHARAHRQ